MIAMVTRDDYIYIHLLFSDITKIEIPLDCVSRLGINCIEENKALDIIFDRCLLNEQCSIEINHMVEMLKTKDLDYILLLDGNREPVKSFNIKEKGRDQFEFFGCNGKYISLKVAESLLTELE